MNHLTTAATPNGSGNALNYRHGSPRKNIPACRGWLPFTLLILAAYLMPGLAVILAADSERVEVGEISAFGGDCSVEHATAGIGVGVQTGGAIYVGDWIKTGSSGSIELVFGINNRIRLAGDTVIRISSLQVKEDVNSGYNRKTQMVEIFLKQGEVRIRVRENLVTPTPIMLVAANLRVILPRSDFIINRPKEEVVGAKDISVVLAWGRAVLNAKTAGEKDWNPDLEMKAVAPGECVVPVDPAGDYLLKWERNIEDAAAMKKVEELPFSIDAIKDAPKDTPVVSPEMQGAWLDTLDKLITETGDTQWI